MIKSEEKPFDILEWKAEVIDFFAFRYGWSVSNINEIYVEEAIPLFRMSRDREKSEKADKIMDYIITLASGFSDNREQINIYRELYDSLTGHGDSNAGKPYWEVTELDRDALERTKKELQKANQKKGH